MKEVIKAMKKMINGKAHKNLSPDELDIVTGGGSHDVVVDGEEFTIYIPDLIQEETEPEDKVLNPHAKNYKGGYVIKKKK